MIKKPKCDGDHAEPPCDDPECWLLDDSTERADEYTETDDEIDRTTSEQLSSIFWMLVAIWVAVMAQTCVGGRS